MNGLAKLFLVAGLVGALVSAVGVAGGPRSADSPQPTSFRARAIKHRTSCDCWAIPSVPEEPDPRPLVWVVDGAGDLKGCSHALTQANTQAGNAIELSAFAWSHGHRRLLVDQIDWSHARVRGEQLAAAILDHKAREPNRRVVLVATAPGVPWRWPPLIRCRRILSTGQFYLHRACPPGTTCGRRCGRRRKAWTCFVAARTGWRSGS